MNSLPVIARELRTEARHSLSYWLRVLGAAIMLLMAVAVVVDLRGNIAGRGGVLFGVLQPTLFSLIWVLAPILTCDSISRERREGTLGLLFLTPLRPADVGLAKALSGILRAFALILAMLPVITIPLLLGGVSRNDLLRAALMDLMALLASIAAGLLASGRCREFSRAALLGMVCSGLFLVLLGALPVMYFLSQVLNGAWGGLRGIPTWAVPVFILVGPWVICAGVDGVWQNSPWATTPAYLQLAVAQVFAALLLLLVVLLLLNRHLRRLSVETGMSLRQVWWRDTFCTPRMFKSVFRRLHRGLLNRNPIGWLQRRTWSSRLATWGWLGALLAVETFLATAGTSSGFSWSDLMQVQPILALFLAVGLAFSSADSFRQERETGALELLLVTPLSVGQVIRGRLSGLWGQYLPVLLLLVASWWYTTSWQQHYILQNLPTTRQAVLLLFISSFACLPVIGLNQSLVRRHFFGSWLVTILLGLVIPFGVPIAGWTTLAWLAIPAGAGGIPGGPDTWGLAWMVAALQGAIAGWSAVRVSGNLQERRFTLHS